MTRGFPAGWRATEATHTPPALNAMAKLPFFFFLREKKPMPHV